MIFIQGFPKDTGATDMMDSSRLAGMMAVTGHPETPDLSKYVSGIGICVRCPVREHSQDEADLFQNFSRDQLMVLVMGLHIQGRLDVCLDIYEIHKARGWFCQNGDWLSPSHRLHLKYCAGLGNQVTGFEKFWLQCDVVWAAKVQTMSETNQLLAILLIAPPAYMDMYCRLRDRWADPILAYWDSWRGEQFLAYQIIRVVHEKRGKINATT